jgi:hypothetical protein
MTWQGRAWRLRIPKSSILFGRHEANNVLEYLAMVITIWLCLLHCKEEALAGRQHLGRWMVIQDDGGTPELLLLRPSKDGVEKSH